VSTSGSKTDAGSPAIGDLELMRYLDGELDDPERSELEAELAADERAAAKLGGLEQLGDFLREAVAADERGDSIADSVMAAIEAGAEAGDDDESGADVIELRRTGEPKLDPVDGDQVAVDQVVGDQVVGARVAQPANDNSRLIYSVFAAAAAVAIGLFVWGTTGPDAETVAMTDRPAAATEAAAPEASPAAKAAEGARAKAASEAAAEDEDEPVVEIAAVDFGAQSGSVFYVSAGKNAAGSTAVVWVTDLGD